MALSHCRHDIGALLWLNVETLERVSLEDLYGAPPMGALSRERGNTCRKESP